MTSPRSSSNTNLKKWLEAANLTAEFLHHAASSEEEILQLFTRHIEEMGFRGGIALLDPSDNRLYFKSIAEPGRKGLIKQFEKLLNLKAREFSIDIDQVDVYRKAIKKG